jgi:hypothetical protein
MMLQASERASMRVTILVACERAVLEIYIEILYLR